MRVWGAGCEAMRHLAPEEGQLGCCSCSVPCTLPCPALICGARPGPPAAVPVPGVSHTLSSPALPRRWLWAFGLDRPAPCLSPNPLLASAPRCLACCIVPVAAAACRCLPPCTPHPRTHLINGLEASDVAVAWIAERSVKTSMSNCGVQGGAGVRGADTVGSGGARGRQRRVRRREAEQGGESEEGVPQHKQGTGGETGWACHCSSNGGWCHRLPVVC